MAMRRQQGTGTVGIVIRTKDRPELLGRALDSVLGQNFDDWRAIVVNDAGDPAPVEALVAARADGRIAILHRDRSAGMEAASNAGIGALKCRYLAIHDDDDSWEAAFLARTVGFLEANPDHGGVVTGCVQRFETLEGGQVTEQRRQTLPLGINSVSLSAMAYRNQFPPIALLIRRSALDTVGHYDESLPVLGDWEFNLRLLTAFPLGFVGELLANWHIREGQGAAASSVTARVDLHQAYEIVIRDRFLRQNGAADLAMAVNMRPLLSEVLEASRHQVQLAESLQERAGHLEAILRETLQATRMVEDLTRVAIQQGAENEKILRQGMAGIPIPMRVRRIVGWMRNRFGSR